MPATTQKAREHKQLGLCAVCDRPLFKGARCRYHWYKQIETSKKYYQRNIEKLRKYARDRRIKLKDNGLCIWCGKKLPEGFTGNICPRCGELRRLREQ